MRCTAAELENGQENAFRYKRNKAPLHYLKLPGGL